MATSIGNSNSWGYDEFLPLSEPVEVIEVEVDSTLLDWIDGV